MTMHEGPRVERVEDLRSLPAVDAVLLRPFVAAMIAEHGRPAVLRAVREAIAGARAALREGREAAIDESEISLRARRATARSLTPVINGTGVLVHTNLGRVPLAREALDAVSAIAGAYSTLEYEREAGRRGHRHVHVTALLRELTGAEDALVVNNNAAALLLALGATASGREAIVSRGELVEIGGGFRVPEVVARSGARLREVGTTNRTHRRDYEGAIGADTAVLLKVHRSNFAMTGFTSEVGLETLAELAGMRGLSLIYDAGSGCMPAVAPLVREPTVADHVAAGADVVTFSGDKLLGGPQAGVVVGRREAIERMRQAPLYRALRPDKMTLAALTATLELWRDAPERLPIVRMLRASVDALEARCRSVMARVAETSFVLAVAPSVARVGGGAAPAIELASRAIRVAGGDIEALAARLRTGEPAVIARIEDGAVWIDLRCVPEDDEPALTDALARALTAP